MKAELDGSRFACGTLQGDALCSASCARVHKISRTAERASTSRRASIHSLRSSRSTLGTLGFGPSLQRARRSMGCRSSCLRCPARPCWLLGPMSSASQGGCHEGMTSRPKVALSSSLSSWRHHIAHRCLPSSLGAPRQEPLDSTLSTLSLFTESTCRSSSPSSSAQAFSS